METKILQHIAFAGLVLTLIAAIPGPRVQANFCDQYSTKKDCYKGCHVADAKQTYDCDLQCDACNYPQ